MLVWLMCLMACALLYMPRLVGVNPSIAAGQRGVVADVRVSGELHHPRVNGRVLDCPHTEGAH